MKASKKETEQINNHLEARWKRIVENGWQGKITKETYFKRNFPYVLINIRNGLIPDGNGMYKNL